MPFVDWGAETGGPPGAIGLRPPTARPPQLTETVAKSVQPTIGGLTDDDLKQHAAMEFRKYGQIDQPTIEAMLVAMFVSDPETDKELSEIMKVERMKESEVVFTSGIRGEWFDNKFLGAVFEVLREQYREHRRMITIDDASAICLSQGQTQNQAIMFSDELVQCHAILLLRKVRADILVTMTRNRYMNKKADKIYQTLANDRKDTAIGPEKAIEKFRKSVTNGLSMASSSLIKEHDWIDDYKETMSRLLDMKHHPEKYMGFKCGIKPIDDKTHGFRPGHLTVFVGMHGGFKSTMMMNVGYGLWKKGYNVLYASLEMSADDVKMKLWCRATKRVSFKKIYSGHMSEAQDWNEIDNIDKLLLSTTDEAERAKLTQKKTTIQNMVLVTNRGINQVPLERGNEDKTMFENHYELLKAQQNKFKIVNVGQSNKIKCSEIETWLKEQEGQFKPHVVIVDYLDLVAPETAYSDRRDQELGDVCKYLRQMGFGMGFAVVTAAQFKRPAVERIRKTGLESPEKSGVGTDDIAGSNQIGADADDVFALFKLDGGNRLQILTPKARYDVQDIDKGVIINIDPDTCTIPMDGEDIVEDISIRGSKITIGEAHAALSKINDNRQKTCDDDPDEDPVPTLLDYDDQEKPKDLINKRFSPAGDDEDF